MCLDLNASGEQFTGAGLGPVAGPLAVFELAVPNDTALCGRRLYSQALHLSGVVPFALSNAQELIIGS